MTLAVVSLLVSSLAAQTPDLSFGNAPTEVQAAEYLTRKKSDLAPAAGTFISEGRKWNIDPRLIMAIAGAETTFGKHLCAKNNAWNWFHKRTCKPSEFPSYEEGIQTVTKFMRRSYVQRGYNTIPLIRARYCAEGCDNWTKLVSHFRDEIPTSVVVVAPTPRPTLSPTPSPTPTPPPTPQPASSHRRPFGLPIALYFFTAAGLVSLWIRRLLGGN